MTKAKTIDRLEWTRRHSRLLETRGDEAQNNTENLTQKKSQYVRIPAVDLLSREFVEDFARFMTGHYNRCPMCGNFSLIHVEGCERCIVCGYDACAWREV